MKYLKLQQQEDIPSNAEKLFAQNETFQIIRDNLDLIVGWYNEAGSEGETTQLLFQAGRDWGGLGATGTSPQVPAHPGAKPRMLLSTSCPPPLCW